VNLNIWHSCQTRSTMSSRPASGAYLTAQVTLTLADSSQHVWCWLRESVGRSATRPINSRGRRAPQGDFDRRSAAKAAKGERTWLRRRGRPIRRGLAEALAG